MPAAYDSYDYPSYWENRKYEHEAEVLALKKLLKLVPKTNTIIEIGAGYGRLVNNYYYRAKKIILTDPSAKLLKIASKNFSHKKLTLIQSNLENTKNKIKKESADLVVMIRVIHHLKDLNKSMLGIRRLAKKNSYFILEFPNKGHIKKTFLEILRGNLTFPLDILPKDIRSKKFIKKKTLPFTNFHPDFITDLLNQNGFKIIKKLSVSNFRYSWFKKSFPNDFILFLENCLQNKLSVINFGPSIFILAKKVK